MSVPSTVRAVWKSAELMIAFHKNKKRERRDAPYLWRPKDAIARLLAKPEDQEAFIVLKAVDDAEDVQIKLHPDKMIVRRAQPLGWSGIIIDEHSVKVKVDDDWIRVSSDGSVKIERDAETTYLEGDGSIIRTSPDAEITVSSDGQTMSRRTGEQIDAFTPDGFALKDLIAASKARRAESTTAEDVFVPAEHDTRRLGASQVRAAIMSKARVQDERGRLGQALASLYVAPRDAQTQIEENILAGQVNADSIGREIRDKPEIYGEVRSFKSGWLGREDREAKARALASASRAGRDFAGTVHYYIGALRNNELEIAEQQVAGIPAPSRVLASALEQTPPGGTLFSGITQEDRRDRLVSEAQTLASQIQRRGPSQAGVGLTRHLASRLQDLQARLKSAVTVERSRKLELEQRLEGPQVSR